MDGWRDWVLLGGVERVSSCRNKSVDSVVYLRLQLSCTYLVESLKGSQPNINQERIDQPKRVKAFQGYSRYHHNFQHDYHIYHVGCHPLHQRLLSHF